MVRETGNMGVVPVVGTVEGVEVKEEQKYSFILFHTRSNLKNKIEHRMFTWSNDVEKLGEGDLVEFYCKIVASPVDDKLFYNLEVKAFNIIKKANTEY